MGRRVSKWTPERLDKVAQMLSEGTDYKEIAKAFGTTSSNIGYTIFKYKIKPSTNNCKVKEIKKKTAN